MKLSTAIEVIRPFHDVSGCPCLPTRLTPDERAAWAGILFLACSHSLITVRTREDALDILGHLSVAPHVEVLVLAALVMELCDELKTVGVAVTDENR